MDISPPSWSLKTERCSTARLASLSFHSVRPALSSSLFAVNVVRLTRFRAAREAERLGTQAGRRDAMLALALFSTSFRPPIRPRYRGSDSRVSLILAAAFLELISGFLAERQRPNAKHPGNGLGPKLVVLNALGIITNEEFNLLWAIKDF